ncbi:Nifu-like protein 3 protein [Thalictrum thalictroides]|uniref:Nifu-like protein 3 protein n=1 Tax=Thalictrum thalictroides TaxID=46969 RepID=A0A7J6VIW9_THATH|nr:Nifu-like protein 3 protein [Thalictrum thalictroides]
MPPFVLNLHMVVLQLLGFSLFRSLIKTSQIFGNGLWIYEHRTPIDLDTELSLWVTLSWDKMVARLSRLFRWKADQWKGTEDQLLAEIRPYLTGTGGGLLELVQIDECVVKVRLSGPAAAVMTVRVAITQKLREKIPVIAAVQLIE